MTREEYGKIGRRRRFCQKSRIWKKSHMFHWNPFVYVKYCFTDTHVQYSINPDIIWCLGALLLGNSPHPPPFPPHRLSPHWGKIWAGGGGGGKIVFSHHLGASIQLLTHTPHMRGRGGGLSANYRPPSLISANHKPPFWVPQASKPFKWIFKGVIECKTDFTLS